jgi:hypothetical protein
MSLDAVGSKAPKNLDLNDSKTLPAIRALEAVDKKYELDNFFVDMAYPLLNNLELSLFCSEPVFLSLSCGLVL